MTARVRVPWCVPKPTEFCDNRGHPSVDERLPVQGAHVRGGGGGLHLLQPRYKQQQRHKAEVNTVLRPQTTEHVGEHWDSTMLRSAGAPQHQHPRLMRRKETPRAAGPAGGMRLAASDVNHTLMRFDWMAFLGEVRILSDSKCHEN